MQVFIKAALSTGSGKIGGACFWFEEMVEDRSNLVIMCRLHSLECISGVALDDFNVRIFGLTPKCENEHSQTVKSLKTMCFNLRYLTRHFDVWSYAAEENAECSWPHNYEAVDLEEGTFKYITDVQKKFAQLIFRKTYCLEESNFNLVSV